MGRRTYSREFKLSAIGLVQQQDYTVFQAAKSLGIDPASLRWWLKQFPADSPPPPHSAGVTQAELRRLPEEVRRLTMELDILKKRPLFSRRSRHEMPLHPRTSRRLAD
jgi:transposase